MGDNKSIFWLKKNDKQLTLLQRTKQFPRYVEGKQKT